MSGLVASTAGFSRFGLECSAAERASSLVQAALKAETILDGEERAQQLETALLREPGLAEAHWARGEVRVQGRWMTLEDAAAQSVDRTDLEQYKIRRGQTGQSVEAQLRLAEYCHKHRMTGQERAHLNAVLALAPNNAEAHRKLGHINVNGTWIDQQQLAEQKKKETALMNFLLKHGDKLVALSQGLFDKSISQEKVITELQRFRDPLVIPGLEYLFSNSSAEGGHCVVKTLVSMPAPEASISLARHALDFPDNSVREEATNGLRRRDENSFVPVLLGALQTPVKSKDQIVLTPQFGLMWRRTLTSETQDVTRIDTLDRFFSPRTTVARRGMVSFINPDWMASLKNWSENLKLNADMELAELNRNIESSNTRIMRLITETVAAKPESQNSPSMQEEELKTTPEQWWNWWNARVESYPAGTKRVQSTYDVAYAYYPTYARRHECLAPGTPIWTETGLAAVEEIKIGDVVLAQNARSGELKYCPVIATTTRTPEMLLRLNLGDETVRSTGGHEFWVSGRGWMRARSLEPGMGLHTARGFVILKSVQEETDLVETHNLIVEDCHSYFVGTNLVLSRDNTVRIPVANRVPGMQTN